MNYVTHLIQSKGLGQLTHRGLILTRRYGVTPNKMVQAFEALLDTVERYDCQATFPVTAVALARNPAPIRRLQERGMELAVHGWTHVDLERYSLARQREHLSRALDIFEQYGISASGFRSPYLRHNGTIRQAVEATGFRYLSNQPILWDVVRDLDWPSEKAQIYRQAVLFYTPWSPARQLSLPTAQGQTLEIPVSLPDDEMLVERLGASSAQIAQAWGGILDQTYDRGELFTLQLHPERAVICASALDHVLSRACACDPPVWIARLGEIAEWWQQRSALNVDLAPQERGQYAITIRGPAMASALVRSAQVIGEAKTWADDYQLVESHCFSVRCDSRPIIGVSHQSNESLSHFLKHQGYLFEIGEERDGYLIYLDRPGFAPADEKTLIEQIEASQSPLIRINRWPGSARSALAISGDIDGLTLWDYGLRLVGK